MASSFFPDHIKSKMIWLIFFSAQTGKGTTDLVYHKPDKAKVLIIMDLPFRDKLRNFHDSNLLASLSIQKFQLRHSKSLLDVVKKTPSEGGAEGATGSVMGFGMAECGEEGKVVTGGEVGAVGGVGAGWVALVSGGGTETRAELVALGWEWFG